jgi:transforming growth factor-beta-induced protein
MNRLNILPLLLLLISLHSCSKDENESQMVIQKTIFEHVASSMNYSYLTYALQKTDLDDVLNGAGDYTLYAPDNSAFIGFLMRGGYSSLDDVPTEALKKLLLNHVMARQIRYRDFKSGYYPTAASSDVNDRPLSMYINQVNMRVTLNGSSRIVQGNVNASNGVIHAVNAVISIPSLVTFVLADPNLYNLGLALTRDDLTLDFPTILSTEYGSAPAPFTVFAPNNIAFVDLLNELKVERLSSIDEPTLNLTLNHHVLGETNALSTDLSDNLTLNTLGVKSLPISQVERL